MPLPFELAWAQAQTPTPPPVTDELAGVNPLSLPPNVLDELLQRMSGGQPAAPVDEPLAPPVEPAQQLAPAAESPPPTPDVAPGPPTVGLHPVLDPTNVSTAAQSTAQEATQLEELANSKLRQQQAEAEAAGAVAQAEGDVNKTALDQLEGAVGGRAMARDQARRLSTAKLAMAQDRVTELTNREPDPARFWENASGFKKAAYTLSVLAGILSTGGNPNAKNAALELLFSDIDADVGSQEKLLGRQRAAALSRLDSVKADGAEELSRVEEQYQAAITRIAGLNKLALAKAQQAGAGSRQAAAYEAVSQELLGAAAKLTERAGARLEKQENQTAEFAEARKRQGREFAHSDAQQFKSFAQQERMAGIGLRNDLIKKGADGNDDLRFVPPKSGLRLVTNGVDEQGNPIVVPTEQAKLHKDYVLKASEISASANQLTADLAQLQDILDDKSNWEAIVKDDAVYNSKITEVVRKIITNPAFNKGATADRDELAGFAVVEGTPANGGVAAKLANFYKRADNARAAIGRLQKDLPYSINTSLKQFPIPGGGNIEWVPEPIPSRPVDGDKYLVPGEKDARLSQSISQEAKLPLDQALPVPTSLKAMTEDQIQTAKALEPALEGMTPETMAAVIKAKLPGDAARRVVLANQEAFDRAHKKLEEVAAGVVKKHTKREFVTTSTLKGYIYKPYSPTKAEMREELLKAGFAPGKLRESDYEALRKRAVAWVETENAKAKRGGP